MKLGYGVGYWKAGPPPGALKAIRTAERLGFDSVWTAEAYGSDAFTPLAWWGARTKRITLGTGIAQLSARTPTAAAMAALTLDHLSGGRVVHTGPADEFLDSDLVQRHLGVASDGTAGEREESGRWMQ